MSVLLFAPKEVSCSLAGHCILLAKAVFPKAFEHAIVPESVFISAVGYYPSTTYIMFFPFCFWIKSH